jgi:putative ABC transport system substrate-binding protein
VNRGLCAMALAMVLAATQSLAVRAEEPAQRVVRLGFVGPLSPSTLSRYHRAFWERLPELGWIEGQNLIIESRSADGHLERLPALMADVIDRKVDILVTYGIPGAIAARKATSTIPIVALALSDPIRTGLVASLARPGGNLTGMSNAAAEGLAGKYIELLRDAVPRLATVALIVNPNNPMPRELAKDIQAFAPALNLKLHIIELRGPEALSQAFESARQKAQAVVVMGEPFTLEYRKEVIALAAKHRLPAIYLDGSYVEAGGLMSYGPDFPAMWRRGAEYVDKILRGAKPADLPIEQPTRYVLSVNLKTAKALGLAIPESILLRADEVIK